MKLLNYVAVLGLAVILSACSSSGPKKVSPETSYAYSAEQKELTVTFSNGTKYIYADVPADVYGQVESAESKGKAFNELVKGKYKATKVE